MSSTRKTLFWIKNPKYTSKLQVIKLQQVPCKSMPTKTLIPPHPYFKNQSCSLFIWCCRHCGLGKLKYEGLSILLDAVLHKSEIPSSRTSRDLEGLNYFSGLVRRFSFKQQNIIAVWLYGWGYWLPCASMTPSSKHFYWAFTVISCNRSHVN